MFLTSITDIIRIVTTTTAAIDVQASWTDITTTAFTPGRTNTKISSATTTTVVDHPIVSAQRQIKDMVITNIDGSNSNVVTIQHFDGTTSVTVLSTTLTAGQKIQYNGANFITDTGAIVPIGSTITGGTGGSILHVSSTGTLAQDNVNLFYDTTNKQLGVGGNTFLAAGNVINAISTNTASSQINAQNKSNGTSASTDVVATADTGDNSTNYMVHGINSSNYNDAGYTIGGALDGYVQAQGGNMTIGTGTANKVIKFHTGGTLAANLRATMSDTNTAFTTTASSPNFMDGYTTTVTSASPLVITATSNYFQFFTGSTAQTVTMPVVTTLTLGQTWEFFNASSAAVTLNSSGSNAIVIVAAGTTCCLTCIKITADTTAAAWSAWYDGIVPASGKKLTVSNTLTLAGTDGDTLTVPSSGGTAVVLTGTQSITGVKTMTNMTALTNTASVPAITIPAGGTVLGTATAGALETDATALYYTLNTTAGRELFLRDRIFRLTGAGSAISTIADVFGSTDGIALVANGVYEIEWNCILLQNAGAATTWTFTIVTATTALASIRAEYTTNAIAGIGTAAATQYAAATATSNSSLALPVTGSMAAATHFATIKALVVAGNGASNIRLRLTVAANNATPQANSYFRVRMLSTGNTGAFVA